MKKLAVTFEVPKTKIKNSNAALSHIIAAQKSAWLRAYAEPIWTEEVYKQFQLTAIEPSENQLPVLEMSPEAKEVLEHLNTFTYDLESLIKEEKYLLSLKETHKNNKVELKKLVKEKADSKLILELEEKINSYDTQLSVIKASKTRLKSTISSIKRMQLPAVEKELKKIEARKRKDYIKKKLELNSSQQLFQKCAVIVKVSNITSHEFDSPNFYPTIKPILDAATDSGVVWADDNNNIISGGVLFLPGTLKSKENYIFEIEIVDDWPWKE